jgi:hypothetical protein
VSIAIIKLDNGVRYEEKAYLKSIEPLNPIATQEAGELLLSNSKPNSTCHVFYGAIECEYAHQNIHPSL